MVFKCNLVDATLRREAGVTEEDAARSEGYACIEKVIGLSSPPPPPPPFPPYPLPFFGSCEFMSKTGFYEPTNYANL